MEISEDADVTHHHLSWELLQRWQHSLLTIKTKNLIIDDPNDDTTFFSLQFFGQISLQLKNLFRSHNINICFKVQHTSRHFLSHSKDPTPQLHRSGVYKLSCCTPQCSAFYIGQTGRKFAACLHEQLC